MTRRLPLDTLRVLMSPDLPEHLDPIRLCKLGALVEGKINTNEFSNLKSFLFDDSGLIEFKLEFFCDNENRHIVNGRYQGAINLICQRCLGKTEHLINAQPKMIVVRTLGEVAAIPKGYEPLLIEDVEIPLIELLEEELMLSVPMVPRCENKSCAEKYDGADTRNNPDRHRPFVGLSKLMSNKE